MSTTYTAYEIPTAPTPLQCGISLGGIQYQLQITWNNIAQIWVLNISDNNGNAILNGIALTCGLDLLGQFEYLNLGGSLYAQTDNAPNAVPTFTNLGEQGHLYFVVANS